VGRGQTEKQAGVNSRRRKDGEKKQKKERPSCCPTGGKKGARLPQLSEREGKGWRKKKTVLPSTMRGTQGKREGRKKGRFIRVSPEKEKKGNCAPLEF